MQKEETSTLVQDILKMYMIRDSQSEPHYQHQNPAEHRIQDVKRMTSSIMDHVGCQAHWWLLCMTYDRILTYGTLLDVLWQMYHPWITYGTVRRIV